MEAMTIRSNLKYHIMKKLFRHFLSAILFAVPCMYASAAWDGTSAAEYAGGNGTKDNPYLIATESQFAKFANDVSTIPGFSRGRYFKLTADLVMYEGVGSNMSSSMNGGKAYSLPMRLHTRLHLRVYSTVMAIPSADYTRSMTLYAYRYSVSPTMPPSKTWG